MSDPFFGQIQYFSDDDIQNMRQNLNHNLNSLYTDIKDNCQQAMQGAPIENLLVDICKIFQGILELRFQSLVEQTDTFYGVLDDVPLSDAPQLAPEDDLFDDIIECMERISRTPIQNVLAGVVNDQIKDIIDTYQAIIVKRLHQNRRR